MRVRKNLRRRQDFGKIKKKAQEEIVGFVAIILIVAIVFVIILGFAVRKNPVGYESGEYYQLLEAMLQYTTPCALSYEPNYLKLGELLEECNAGARCVDGKDSCEVAKNLIKNILDEIFYTVGPNSSIIGYQFVSSYEINESSTQILKIENGECRRNYKGAEKLSPAFPGSLSTTLKVCLP